MHSGCESDAGDQCKLEQEPLCRYLSHGTLGWQKYPKDSESILLFNRIVSCFDHMRFGLSARCASVWKTNWHEQD